MPSSNIVLLEPNGPRGQLEPRESVPKEWLEIEVETVTRGHRYLSDTEHGVFVSVWDSTPATLKMRPFPRNELMLVLDGSVTVIDAAGREDTFRAGDCFIFPQAFNRQWKGTEYFRKFAVGFTDPSAQDPANAAALRVVRVDPGGLLDEIAGPPAESLLGPVPIQHERRCFADRTGQMIVRVWDTTACHIKPMPTPSHEWMHILDGSVTLTDAAGEAHHFKGGDTFLVALGTVCSWRFDAYLRAIRCSFEPKAAMAKAQAAE